MNKCFQNLIDNQYISNKIGFQVLLESKLTKAFSSW